MKTISLDTSTKFRKQFNELLIIFVLNSQPGLRSSRLLLTATVTVAAWDPSHVTILIVWLVCSFFALYNTCVNIHLCFDCKDEMVFFFYIYLYITLFCNALQFTDDIQKRETSNQKKVVCYYTNWSVYRPGTAKFSPQNINPYLCTHLIYAFGGLDKENGLRPYDKYQDIEQGKYFKLCAVFVVHLYWLD